MVLPNTLQPHEPEINLTHSESSLGICDAWNLRSTLFILHFQHMLMELQQTRMMTIYLSFSEKGLKTLPKHLPFNRPQF